MSRSDRFTLKQKQKIVYSDFTTNFDRNPHTGYLNIVTNENSVKQMLKSLFLTDEGERFGNADYGGGIKHALFENIDGGTGELLKFEMSNMINAYLPMVDIQEIQVITPTDANVLDIRLVYRIENIIDVQTLDLNIKRVR